MNAEIIPYSELSERSKTWRRLVVRFGRDCYICGALATTKDHVVPSSSGGSNHEGNLRPCCFFCNREKANLSLSEYLAKRVHTGRMTEQAAEEVLRRIWQYQIRQQEEPILLTWA